MKNADQSPCVTPSEPRIPVKSPKGACSFREEFQYQKNTRGFVGRPGLDMLTSFATRPTGVTPQHNTFGFSTSGWTKMKDCQDD